MKKQRFLAACLGLVAAMAAAAAGAAPDDSGDVAQGRRIYNEGILASGARLTGTGVGRDPVSGAAAACVNCHRRSGMGQVEGNVPVQPITGAYLFAPPGDRRIATMDPRVSKAFNQAHDPYTEESLAAAIRDGNNNQGRAMSVVMPRYALEAPDLRALTAYLRQLSMQWSPGVTQSEIRFATVITPDVDPVRRKVFIDMMRAIVRQKNGSTVTASQNRSRRHMTSAAELILGTERNWDLEIWELQGAPQTWGEQLRARYASHPVFALLSGLADGTWQPVQDFCEREGVPCWFPSVPVPGRDPADYAFYFSGGVKLESAVLARHLIEAKSPPRRVVQIYRDAGAGPAAAQALADALAGSGIVVASRVLRSDPGPAEALRQALDAIQEGDALMFWLRPDDIQALADIKPLSVESYFSSVLSAGEHAPVPAPWRAHAHLAYLYEMPEMRAKNLDYFHAWLSIGKFPLVDEAMQSEVFFALNFMTDTLSEMLDNLYRDYLVERAETMLSRREGIKSEQENRDRVALGREGDMQRRHGPMTIEESARIQVAGRQEGSGSSHGTTLYPHLSLGPGQRFASKSGRIVRFGGESGAKLVAESGVIVP